MSNQTEDKMTEQVEDELVDLARSGDIDAFTRLAERYQERIYRTVLVMCRNHDDADDLAQEVFFQAYKSIKRFKHQSSFYTWIYRIAVNMTLNFLKKRSREKLGEEFSPEQAAPEDACQESLDSPEKKSLKKELRMKLEEAINALPPVFRISFILVEFQDMSHAQAALILKCTENTVSWRIHKARKMLQTTLNSYLSVERGQNDM